MAHFAELDKNNRVLRVIVIDNSVVETPNGDNEQSGIDFCKSIFGEDTNWIQTSYNGNLRGKFAGVGDLYNPKTDAFVEDLEWQKKDLEERMAKLAELEAQQKAIEG